ncbi:terminase small subunit [Aliikangiella coralliicola]|uniref:Terminase small subunit n=1 Tax=Aliikangiella coralliicola TaxID=2592383 RepID=A0A545U7Y1_9GAMM|nr:terminase small subunit [Aliikangiella coralliicola]TQV85568.1 terminase small subunit [Aliikangiella coralliicola]
MRSSNYLRQAKRRQNRSEISDHPGFSPNDKVAGKDSLANIMDVSVTTVERWIRAGMPVEQRGDNLHDWVFDLSEVKNWHLTYKHHE